MLVMREEEKPKNMERQSWRPTKEKCRDCARNPLSKGLA